MKTLFYFDRIRINTMQDPTTLKASLPVETLKPLCRSFQIDRVKSKGSYQGYRSRIDFTAPTDEFLTLLHDCQKLLGPYWVSYVEIAKDEITSTEKEADRIARSFSNTARKKWGSRHFTYDQHREIDLFVAKNDPDLFGTVTLYSQSKNFGIRSYARNSKVSGESAFRREYVVKEPKTIFQKSGISEIGNLIGFRFQNFFRITDNKFLTYNTIDKTSLGKFITGLTRKKHFTNRERWSIGLAGAAYSNNRSAGDLILYFQKLKREIRQKRNPKTVWDHKILGLKTYRYFIKPTDFDP